MLLLDECNGTEKVKGRMSLALWLQQGQLWERGGQDLSAGEFWPVRDLLAGSGGWHVKSLRRQLR